MVGLLPFLLVAAAFGGWVWWHWYRQRQLREGLRRLSSRDGLRLTATPCGLGHTDLAGRSEVTPRGDRRCGLRYAVEGPAHVELAGPPGPVQVAAFEWWYEVRVRDHERTHYRRRTTTVALARLPVRVPGVVLLQPEGLLGRAGLSRSDHQLESEEFNRRFQVIGPDEQLVVRLLDARMQHRLVSSLSGRSVHLGGDLVLLGGSPDHRDGSLPGVIGELPAAVQDLTALLRAVPAALWRTADPSPGHGAGAGW